MQRFGIFRTQAEEHYLIDMKEDSVASLQYVCKIGPGFMKQVAEFNAADYDEATKVLRFLQGKCSLKGSDCTCEGMSKEHNSWCPLGG